jgi:hypothetical protein
LRNSPRQVSCRATVLQVSPKSRIGVSGLRLKRPKTKRPFSGSRRARIFRELGSRNHWTFSHLPKVTRPLGDDRSRRLAGSLSGQQSAAIPLRRIWHLHPLKTGWLPWLQRASPSATLDKRELLLLCTNYVNRRLPALSTRILGGLFRLLLPGG